MANGNGIEIARAFVTIVPSMEGAQKTISEELGAACQSAGKDASDKFSEAFGKTGALDSINKLSQLASNTIGKIGDAALDSAKELDVGYDTIIEKTGATGKQFEDFKKIANNIFGDLPTDMDTVGAAVGEVNTRFKLTGDQLEKTATSFTKFAKINGVDVSGSIDDVQTAMAAFNVSSRDASKVLDVLNKTGQNTGADVGNLSKKVTENATAFRELGLDIYGSIDFMGKLETAGADSQSVLSGLKRALKAATEEGVPLKDALANLEDTIKNGTSSTDGLTAAYDLFGKSGAGIFEAVKNGQISFTDLADSTTILTEATNSLDEAYEGTLSGWDKMTVATNNLKIAGSELTGAFFEAAAPAIDGLTGLIKDLTQGFMDLPDEVQGVIGVIGAVGIEAAKIVPKIIEFTTQLATLKVMKTLAGDASSLSGGIGGLGGALTSINPVFIAIAAAIAAAVAMFMAIKKHIDENTESIRLLKDEAVALEESVGQTVESIRTLSEGELTVATATEKLSDAQANLETLREQNAQATANAEEAERAYAEAIANANTDLMNGIFTTGNAISGIYYYGSALGTINTAMDEYEEAIEATNNALAESDAALQEAQNQVAAYTLLSSEMSDIEKTKTEELLQSIDMTNTASDTYQKYCDDIAALNTAHSNTITALEDLKTSYEAEYAAIEQAQADYQQNTKNCLEQVFGMFNNVTVQVDQSVTDMIASLDSQIAYMDNYQKNLKQAMELGVDEGLIQKLSDGSAESAKILQAIVDDGGENIAELNDKFLKVEEGKSNFTSKVGEIVYDFQGKMDEIKGKLDTTIQAMNQANTAYAAGMNTMQGYINGMNSQEGTLQATASRLAAIPMQVTRAIQNMHSPSKVMEKLGEFTGQGYINGIAKMIKPVAAVSKTMATTTIKSTKTALVNALKSSSSNFADIGRKFADKLNSSIENGLKKKTNQVAKQVKYYFQRYELNLNREENELQKQINRIGNRISAIKTNSKDSDEVKASKELQKKELEQQKKSLQKQLDQLKKYESKFKKIQSQVGNNISKVFGDSLEKYASKVTDKLNAKVQKYTKTMEDKINAVNSKIATMRDKMADYGELFNVKQYSLYGGGVKEVTQLTNLKDQISVLQKYNHNLNVLKGRIKGKLSKDLMAEITDMNIDDAIKYTDELLRMSDKKLKNYNSLYKQKMKLANTASNDFYAAEIKSIKDKYTNKIKDAFKEASTKMKDYGTQAINGFFKGLKSLDVDLEVKSLSNKIIKAFKTALKIKSPSKVMAEIGMYSIQGVIEGAESQEKALEKTYSSLADTTIDAYDSKLDSDLNNRLETKIYSFSDAAAYAHPIAKYNNNDNDKTEQSTPINITLNVYGAEGQDINALANIVINKLQHAVAQKEAVYA